MWTNFAWIAGIALISVGCVADLPSLVEAPDPDGPLVVGRVVTVVTGERGRMYAAEVRFFEIEDQRTHERFTVEIKSKDRYFAIALPVGDYRLNRVQVSEGPFMSMADVSAAFSVSQDRVTDVGTWRFAVDSPRYGRMVILSMVMDGDDRSQTDAFLAKQYPALQGGPITSVLPEPSTMETRLYEVLPYPRYPRYFQRHVW